MVGPDPLTPGVEGITLVRIGVACPPRRHTAPEPVPGRGITTKLVLAGNPLGQVVGLPLPLLEAPKSHVISPRVLFENPEVPPLICSKASCLSEVPPPVPRPWGQEWPTMVHSGSKIALSG